MEDQNVVLFLDKIKKLIELGNKPQAVTEIETLETMLIREVNKKKGKQFLPITIPDPTETEKANPIFLREFEVAHKVNEIINFINNRYPVT